MYSRQAGCGGSVCHERPIARKVNNEAVSERLSPAKGWHGGDSALTVESYCCSWPVHGRTRAQTENYIVPSDCPGPSVRSRFGFQPRVMNRSVDDPFGDTHRYSGAEFSANIGKVLRAVDCNTAVMSATLAPPNPPACTLILSGRNSEALLLSAACTMPTRDRQSKPAANLVTAVKLTRLSATVGALNYRSFAHARWR